MESRPMMASVESLRSTLVVTSHASSRASSRSPTRPTAKRKFSIAARMRSVSDMSSERERRSRKTQSSTDVELAQMMEKIADIQVTGDGKTFRERAKKQLETIGAEHVQQVLEEYTRIPHTLLPLEMLSVPLGTRIRVRESVAKAKAALVARVNEQNEAEDRQDEALQAKRPRPAACCTKLRLPKAEDDSDSTSKCYLRDSESYSKLSVNSQRQSVAFNNRGSKPLYNDQGTKIHPTSLADAGAFARICKETGVSVVTAPITSAVLEALTPPSSRAGTAQRSRSSDELTMDRPTIFGSKRPSKSNPFASFLTESSDAEAESLPNELMLCYFAHNQVQDRLRSIWRQTNKSCSAEQVAREVWEQLPEKYFPVSRDFEGQLAKKALSMDEMVYVWVGKFWDRCKGEGW